MSASLLGMNFMITLAPQKKMPLQPGAKGVFGGGGGYSLNISENMMLKIRQKSRPGIGHYYVLVLVTNYPQN